MKHYLTDCWFNLNPRLVPQSIHRYHLHSAKLDYDGLKISGQGDAIQFASRERALLPWQSHSSFTGRIQQVPGFVQPPFCT